MWLLLGLLGGVAALSAGDMFTSADDAADRDDAADDTLRRDDDPDQDWLRTRGHIVDDDPTDPVGSELPETVYDPSNPFMGLFDGLGTRVHSSDVYPDPEPDTAVTFDGDDTDNRFAGHALDDTLLGHAGHDTLTGAGGDDRLEGGSGDDSLIGGEGDDTLIGGSGNDTLMGGLGNDLLRSGTGQNTVFAGDGEDILVGQSGDSFLNGGNGNDLLQAGAGNQLHGGAGQDIFQLAEPQQSDVQDSATPTHILDYTPGDDLIQLRYDPAQGVPELTISFDPETPDLAQIRIGGQVLATVANAASLTVNDLAFVAVPAS